MATILTDDTAAAARALREGGLVAFPTETVYGLGADAENPVAVRRIFDAKGRPSGHPLIVHIADAAELARWAVAPSPEAMRLAERFWPGPLTLILRRKARVPDAVTGGLDTVGLRVPAHPLALALLRDFGGGVAAPSANPFGGVSPTTARHVADALGDAVDLVLDGGPCTVGIESTIIDMSGDEPAVLRPGGVTVELLSEALGRAVGLREGGEVRSPGQLPSHYKPRARVRVMPLADLVIAVEGERAAGARVGVIAPASSEALALADVAFPSAADAEDMARRLYAAFHEADARGCDVVLVARPASAGLGLAIGDRLARAARDAR